MNNKKNTNKLHKTEYQPTSKLTIIKLIYNIIIIKNNLYAFTSYRYVILLL